MIRSIFKIYHVTFLCYSLIYTSVGHHSKIFLQTSRLIISKTKVLFFFFKRKFIEYFIEAITFYIFIMNFIYLIFLKLGKIFKKQLILFINNYSCFIIDLLDNPKRFKLYWKLIFFCFFLIFRKWETLKFFKSELYFFFSNLSKFINISNRYQILFILLYYCPKVSIWYSHSTWINLFFINCDSYYTTFVKSNL